MNIYKKVLTIQVALIVICFLISFVCRYNSNTLLSVALGGFLAILPNFVYAKIVNVKCVLPVHQVLPLHQKALLLKFFVNLVAFVCVLVLYRQVDSKALFITYVVTLGSYWIALVI